MGKDMALEKAHRRCRNDPMPPGNNSSGPTCVALRTAVTGLTRLDDFELDKIGEGFFAEVYKVRHIVTGEVMVLKLSKSPNNRSHSLHEVQLMKTLRHPNILRFHGVCVHEGQLHPLVEYINGGVLEELLLDHGKVVEWPVRYHLSSDIAKGMAYLHSKGLFHRDLTSKNVLIRRCDDGTLQAVVADFGLAAKIPPLSRETSMSVVGSPYWMAPEVLHGEKYNEKADVFSYGIILCEILTRVGADPDILPRTATFGLDNKRFLEMCRDCPPCLCQLALHCCQLSPMRRFTFNAIVELLAQTGPEGMWNVSPRLLPAEPASMESIGPVSPLPLVTSDSGVEYLQIEERTLLCLSPPAVQTNLETLRGRPWSHVWPFVQSPSDSRSSSPPAPSLKCEDSSCSGKESSPTSEHVLRIICSSSSPVRKVSSLEQMSLPGGLNTGVESLVAKPEETVRPSGSSPCLCSSCRSSNGHRRSSSLHIFQSLERQPNWLASSAPPSPTGTRKCL